MQTDGFVTYLSGENTYYIAFAFAASHGILLSREHANHLFLINNTIRGAAGEEV